MIDLHIDPAPGIGARASLERALRDAIRGGRLMATSTLPSSRSLASDLGISRSTVVAAYEQLVAEGYLRAEHGSGTRVASIRPPGEPEPEVDPFGPAPKHDFRPGEPDPSSFPRTRWMRSLRRAVADAPDSAFGYPHPQGVAELRNTLAEHLSRTRAVAASPTSLQIVGGYGAGLGFLAEALRAQGVERIAVEDPMLPFHTQTIRAAGVTTIATPLDAEGIDLDTLIAAGVGAVVVTPAHQYPSAITMSARRRTDLIEWARRNEVWIIEDDYDGEFRYDRRPIGSLQGLAPDRVVYAGTTSKSMAPALRLGWLVVPDGLRSALARIVNVRGGVSALDQLALADFIDRGELDRHVRHMRGIYRLRHDALCSRLAEVAPWLDVDDGAAGLHLAAYLHSDHLDEASVLAATDAASVGLLGLRTHHRSSTSRAGFAIGFSRPPEHHFPTALSRLGDVLAEL